MPTPALNRRQALLAGGALACAPMSFAQPGKAAAGKPLTIAQIVDTSTAQQDVSRDFLIGSRAAWQDINARGGVRGRPVQHASIEVDGSPASVKAALASVKDNPSCVLLSGTAGDPVATQIAELLRQESMPLAHAAPWLQNSSLQVDDRTFPVFAGRQEQVTHALKSLTVMGVHDLGAIYATPADYRLYREDVERIAAGLQLKLTSFRGEGDLTALGQRLTPGTPAILIFVGGTPELVQFTQGLEKQQRQRYLLALADVNLQTVMQMGGARTTSVIITQTVPLVTSALPVVRQYRDVMSRLFDEPPVPLSLAGFIAARYTCEVLNAVDGAITRQSALAQFQRREAVDIGGYRVAFDSRRRAGSYVTQSMLTQDGRVIG